MRSVVPLFAFFTLASVTADASAGDAKQNPPATVVTRHGSQIHSPLVGPAAGGFVPKQTSPGAVLRDGAAYMFATLVASRARYDGWTVDGPHLLIERVQFDGNLDIYTRLPVVMRGVHINLARSAHWGVQTRPGAGPFYLLWSQISGPSGDPRTAAVGVALMLRANGAVVYRSHLHRTVDGIQPSGSDIRVIESLIDGLVAAPGAHNDGIQMLGAPRSITVLRNRIVNPNPQTSAIAVSGRDIRIEANYLSGGGWTVYGGWAKPKGRSDQPRDVQFIDTVFGRDVFVRGGRFGAVTGWSAVGNVWRDNRFSTGEIVRP